MRHLLAVIITATLIAPAAAQDNEADAWRANLNEHAGDFDYLLGDWHFTSRGAFGEGGGYWTAVRLATGDGSHILDEYRVVDGDGETLFASTTLRVFNASRGLWELVSAEAGTGLENTGTAKKVGDEMQIEQRFGRDNVWRIRYYDIRPDAFSWVADRSGDGGFTWEPGYMTIEARRIGPPRDLEPLASGAKP